jgi:sec-independent protein translocase protein TatA
VPAPVLAIFDSPSDIVIVLLVVVLLFGANQLPKLARSLGSAQREFKKGIEEGEAQADAKASQARAVPEQPGPGTPE